MLVVFTVGAVGVDVEVGQEGAFEPRREWREFAGQWNRQVLVGERTFLRGKQWRVRG